MRRGGRPFRFLGATLGGWIVLRIGVLWPTVDAPRELIRAFAPGADAAPGARDQPPAPAPVVTRPAPATTQPAAVPARVPTVRARPRGPAPETTRPEHADAGPAIVDRAMPIGQGGAIALPLRPTPADPTRRLTASAWSILRDGTNGTLPGGQLGGSQAGLRIAYALGASQRVALAARVSAPLSGTGREAAFGVEYRLARLPLRLIAERRIALDAARDGTALYAVGGIAPTPVAAGFHVEGYAQAGVVLRDGTQAFADGAARLTRALSRSIDVGIGAWGGIQPGVARIDLGPTVGIALPVAGRRVRVSLDWRQRVAGRARPDSGPALSIGSDF